MDMVSASQMDSDLARRQIPQATVLKLKGEVG